MNITFTIANLMEIISTSVTALTNLQYHRTCALLLKLKIQSGLISAHFKSEIISINLLIGAFTSYRVITHHRKLFVSPHKTLCLECGFFNADKKMYCQ